MASGKEPTETKLSELVPKAEFIEDVASYLQGTGRVGAGGAGANLAH